MNKKKETRGGRREGTGGARDGAGRKRNATKWSDAFKEDLVRALNAKQKATGKDIHQVMVECLYDEDTEPRAKTAIYKAVCDALVQKSTHKEVEITETKLGPIVLPARMEGDTLAVPDKVEARH